METNQSFQFIAYVSLNQHFELDLIHIMINFTYKSEGHDF